MTKPRFAYWEKVYFKENPDVVIVGAGIVGLSCALSLIEKNPSINILVLEKLSISRGASTRNAGFTCFGSPSELMADLKHMPEQEVFQTVSERYHGLVKLLDRVGRSEIDFQESGGQEIFFEKDKYEECVEMLPFLNQQISSIVGYDPVYQINKDAKELIGEYYSIKIHREGYLHPGKMMFHLEKYCKSVGITIIKGVEVQSIKQVDDLAEIKLINGHKIQTPHCCVCTNGFSGSMFKEIDVKPARNQVLLSKPIKDNPLKGTYHYDGGYVYWRNVDSRILIGGMRNLDLDTETTDKFGLNPTITDSLKQFVQKHIYSRELEFEYAWSGILGIGNNKQPIVEKVSKSLTLAVRLGGMGLAIGTSVGATAAKLTIA